MALQLDKTMNTGVTGNYWRVTAFSHDRLGAKVGVSVSFYLDAAAATSGKSPLNQYFHTFPEFLSDNQNHIGVSYDLLKTLPEYAGAIDV